MGERRESVKGGGRVPGVAVRARSTRPETVLDGDAQALPPLEAKPPGQDDALLVARSLADDHEAFRILLERYEGAVTALAYAMVGDREAARDVAQEAFCEAYRLLESLRAPEKFGGWVCGIARRKSIYHLRRRKRSRQVRDISLESRARDPALTPSDHLERSEVRRRVLQALERLSEKYRVVLVLKYVEGMSYERIAELMEIRLATVDKRLTRAKAMLRNLLKDL